MDTEKTSISKNEIYNKQDILFHIGFTIKCLVSGAVKFRTSVCTYRFSKNKYKVLFSKEGYFIHCS